MDDSTTVVTALRHVMRSAKEDAVKEWQMVALLLFEGQLLADGFDELHLQRAGALSVSLVASPHPMLQLPHLR